MKCNQQQYKNEFDVQPAGVEIVGRIRRDQHYSGQNCEESARIAQCSQAEPLDSSQACPSFWSRLSYMPQQNESGHQQAGDP
jgi:hypothetical protein